MTIWLDWLSASGRELVPMKMLDVALVSSCEALAPNADPASTPNATLTLPLVK